MASFGEEMMEHVMVMELPGYGKMSHVSVHFALPNIR